MNSNPLRIEVFSRITIVFNSIDHNPLVDKQHNSKPVQNVNADQHTANKVNLYQKRNVVKDEPSGLTDVEQLGGINVSKKQMLHRYWTFSFFSMDHC